ncbi:hypothetical protein D3C87_2003970 [compost metagenome]
MLLIQTGIEQDFTVGINDGLDHFAGIEQVNDLLAGSIANFVRRHCPRKDLN